MDRPWPAPRRPCSWWAAVGTRGWLSSLLSPIFRSYITRSPSLNPIYPLPPFLPILNPLHHIHPFPNYSPTVPHSFLTPYTPLLPHTLFSLPFTLLSPPYTTAALPHSPLTLTSSAAVPHLFPLPIIPSQHPKHISILLSPLQHIPSLPLILPHYTTTTTTTTPPPSHPFLTCYTCTLPTLIFPLSLPLTSITESHHNSYSSQGHPSSPHMCPYSLACAALSPLIPPF